VGGFGVKRIVDFGAGPGAKQKRAVNVRERQAAVLCTTTQTAKLNGLDPEDYLADVLARIANHKIDELLPWRWRQTGEAPALAENAA
jgi:hypothetical protein